MSHSPGSHHLQGAGACRVRSKRTACHLPAHSTSPATTTITIHIPSSMQHLVARTRCVSVSTPRHLPRPRPASSFASPASPRPAATNTTTTSTGSSSSMSAAQQQHPLWQRVLEVYSRAQESGAATKTDTHVQLCQDGGIAFVLRVAAALKAKPKGGTCGNNSQPPRNPFLPYEEELWVQHLSDTHTLLLNKFNVVPHHVLVVTRAYESQQDPLNSRDLEATQQVLSAMPQGGVAFYNCGEHSGRSQPHKHVQIVPLPFVEEQQQQQQQQQQSGSQCSPQPPQPPIQPVVMAAQAAAGAAALQPFEVRQLPYRAYAVALTPSTTPSELEAAASQLLAMCHSGLPSPVSYNVVLTREFLMLVPRRAEMCGRAAINSLGFAGTILLKSDEDLAFAQQQQPLNMLAAVGQPWETASL